VSAALSVLLLLLSDDIPVTGNRRLPSEVAGTWDVVRVAVDNQDASHWGFRPNDPRLLGRTLTVDSVHVRFEDGKELGCKQSTWPARQSTWGYLFSKGFPRPPDDGRSPTPSPEDFEVKVAKNQRAIAYSLCPSPGRGTNRFPADFWVAPLGSEQLALHYDNQVLLLFQRRRREQSQQPHSTARKQPLRRRRQYVRASTSPPGTAVSRRPGAQPSTADRRSRRTCARPKRNGCTPATPAATKPSASMTYNGVASTSSPKNDPQNGLHAR
jgi:hypothetical protein